MPSSLCSLLENFLIKIHVINATAFRWFHVNKRFIHIYFRIHSFNAKFKVLLVKNFLLYTLNVWRLTKVSNTFLNKIKIFKILFAYYWNKYSIEKSKIKLLINVISKMQSKTLQNLPLPLRPTKILSFLFVC